MHRGFQNIGMAQRHAFKFIIAHGGGFFFRALGAIPAGDHLRELPQRHVADLLRRET